MQNIKSIANIYRESELRYKNRNLKFNKNDLQQKVTHLYQQATKNYSQLTTPKTCHRKTYIHIWIHEEIGRDIAKHSLKKPLKLNLPPNNYQASVDFIKNYPPELIKEMRQHQNEMWNQIDFYKLKEKWLALIDERDNLSKNFGFRSQLDMYLKNFKIPASEYEKFLINVNQIIDYCNRNLSTYNLKLSEKESNKFCFICEIKSFPLKTTEELLSIFSEKYTIFKQYKHKINLLQGNGPGTKYIKENDSFEITLNNNTNINHQIMDLIHELAHVESLLRSLAKSGHLFTKGIYIREKTAINIEINFIKKHFPVLFSATLGTILQIIHQTLFEIDISQNSNKNPHRLYAKYYNQCFPGTNQKTNRTYLLNQDILYNHFRLLPYAVAYSNTLVKLLNRK